MYLALPTSFARACTTFFSINVGLDPTLALEKGLFEENPDPLWNGVDREQKSSIAVEAWAYEDPSPVVPPSKKQMGVPPKSEDMAFRYSLMRADVLFPYRGAVK